MYIYIYIYTSLVWIKTMMIYIDIFDIKRRICRVTTNLYIQVNDLLSLGGAFLYLGNLKVVLLFDLCVIGALMWTLTLESLKLVQECSTLVSFVFKLVCECLHMYMCMYIYIYTSSVNLISLVNKLCLVIVHLKPQPNHSDPSCL